MTRGRSSFLNVEALVVLTVVVASSLDLGVRCSPSHRSRHHADLSHEEQQQQQHQRDHERVMRPSDVVNSELPRAEPFSSSNPTDSDPLVIQTRNGRVRGATLKAATGNKVDAWFGIPYAQKPIGEFVARKKIE